MNDVVVPTTIPIVVPRTINHINASIVKSIKPPRLVRATQHELSRQH